jgi:hypothetical protein
VKSKELGDRERTRCAGVAVGFVLGSCAAPTPDPLRRTPRDPFETPQKPPCRLALCLSVCLSVELRWRPSSVFLSVLAPFPPTASSFQGNFFRGAAARADADPAGFLWACPVSCLRSAVRPASRSRRSFDRWARRLGLASDVRPPAVSIRMLTLGWWYGWQSCTKPVTRALNLFCLPSISCGGLDLWLVVRPPTSGRPEFRSNNLFTRPLLVKNSQGQGLRVPVELISLCCISSCMLGKIRYHD